MKFIETSTHIAIWTIICLTANKLLSASMSIISSLYYFLVRALGGIFAKPTWAQPPTESQPAVSLALTYYGTMATLLGYICAEAASPTVNERLLWPSRFYNTISLSSIVKFALLMPMGGVVHKVAFSALRQFSAQNLLGRHSRGDMLGTAFFSDTGKKYKEYSSSTRYCLLEGCVRNGLWVKVLGLVNWGQNPPVVQDAEGRSQSRPLRAIRPVFHLCLTPGDSKSKHLKAVTPTVSGDTGCLQWRTVLGVCASELSALTTSIVVVLHWNTPLAIWFCVPLLLKLLSLATCVRRQPLIDPPAITSTSEHSVIEISDFSNGFIIITGPELLVKQFFRHYGHPQRDRIREGACMILVAASMLIFPAGVLLFAQASQDLQWVWLGYQLYVVLAMLLYRVIGGDSIGTTEEQLAQALDEQKAVSLVDDEGNVVIAKLTTIMVNSVARGREEVERLVSCYGWEDGGD